MQPSGPSLSSFSTSSSTTYSSQTNIPSSTLAGVAPSAISTDSLRLAHQGPDPNSPDTFKENIHLIQEHVSRLQTLSRTVLHNTREAYKPGVSPYQTEADLANLKQSLQFLVDLMRQSGVGALPVLPSLPQAHAAGDQNGGLPTEEQLIADTTNSVKVLYERLKRKQDSAAVVAGLLTTSEHGHSRGGQNVGR